eukprot:scaffold16979_cov58-Phaeocystis_antarctica.AAC.1
MAYLVEAQVDPRGDGAVDGEQELVGWPRAQQGQHSEAPAQLHQHHMGQHRGQPRRLGLGGQLAMRNLLLDCDREGAQQPGAAAEPREEVVLLSEEHVEQDHAEPARTQVQDVHEHDEAHALSVAPLGLEGLGAVQQRQHHHEQVGRRVLEDARRHDLLRPNDRRRRLQEEWRPEVVTDAQHEVAHAKECAEDNRRHRKTREEGDGIFHPPAVSAWARRTRKTCARRGNKTGSSAAAVRCIHQSSPRNSSPCDPNVVPALDTARIYHTVAPSSLARRRDLLHFPSTVSPPARAAGSGRASRPQRVERARWCRAPPHAPPRATPPRAAPPPQLAAPSGPAAAPAIALHRPSQLEALGAPEPSPRRPSGARAARTICCRGRRGHCGRPGRRGRLRQRDHRGRGSRGRRRRRRGLLSVDVDSVRPAALRGVAPATPQHPQPPPARPHLLERDGAREARQAFLGRAHVERGRRRAAVDGHGPPALLEAHLHLVAWLERGGEAVGRRRRHGAEDLVVVVATEVAGPLDQGRL